MKNFTHLFLAFILVLLYSCGSNKSEALLKDWKATELKLGETTLSADDIGGIYFSFKSDSTFVYTETGIAQTGKWAYLEKDNSIELTYTEEGRKVVQAIQELTAEKLVLNYEDHGMKRTISLIPNTK